MKQETKTSGEVWWKVLIILTFISSVFCFGLLWQNRILNTEVIEYETIIDIIELNNNNVFTEINGKIIDYLCSEGVYFANYENSYYASTWENDWNVEEKYRGGNGICLIKWEK